MSKDLIRYDLMIQQALRGVVRNVMMNAQKNGLQGDHHFFIRFKTDVAGIRLSNWLREQFPEEMSIVLQHQYWDLAVTDYAFEVGLSFRGSPERLLVPFDAIVEFQDPSVRFGLVFEPAEGSAGNDDVAGVPQPALPALRTVAPIKPAGGRLTGDPLTKKQPRGAASEPVALPARKEPEKRKPPAVKTPAEKTAPAAEKPAAPKGGEGGTAQVVSLDQFRKKK